MLMQQIFNKIIELIYIIQSKEVIIFGTGKGGSLVAIILNFLKIKKIYFVDNNKEKWGTTLLGIQIYNPEILLQREKGNIIVLIASTHYDEISKQLNKYDLIENIDYHYVLDMVVNTSANESILESIFKINNNNFKNLIFGDSVMSCISKDDDKKVTLYDMIKQKVKFPFNIYGIHNGAFHLGVYYSCLHALIYLKKIPEVIVLPINMRSFSPSWDLNPLYQWAEDIQEVKKFLDLNDYNIDNLLDCDKITEFEEFVNYSTEYDSNLKESNSKFISWENYKPIKKDEINKKYAYLYKWHYMYNLSKENRKFKILKYFIKLVQRNKIKLIVYITPINYRQAEKYIGTKFLEAYKKNIKLIEDFFSKLCDSNIIFDDYSLLFSQNYFTHENDTTEHLNQKGREFLSGIISGKIDQISQ